MDGCCRAVVLLWMTVVLLWMTVVLLWMTVVLLWFYLCGDDMSRSLVDHE